MEENDDNAENKCNTVYSSKLFSYSEASSPQPAESNLLTPTKINSSNTCSERDKNEVNGLHNTEIALTCGYKKLYNGTVDGKSIFDDHKRFLNGSLKVSEEKSKKGCVKCHADVDDTVTNVELYNSKLDQSVTNSEQCKTGLFNRLSNAKSRTSEYLIKNENVLKNENRVKNENSTYDEKNCYSNGSTHNGNISNGMGCNGTYSNHSVNDQDVGDYVNNGSAINGNISNGSLHSQAMSNGKVDNRDISNYSAHNGSINNGNEYLSINHSDQNGFLSGSVNEGDNHNLVTNEGNNTDIVTGCNDLNGVINDSSDHNESIIKNDIDNAGNHNQSVTNGGNHTNGDNGNDLNKTVDNSNSHNVSIDNGSAHSITTDICSDEINSINNGSDHNGSIDTHLNQTCSNIISDDVKGKINDPIKLTSSIDKVDNDADHNHSTNLDVSHVSNNTTTVDLSNNGCCYNSTSKDDGGFNGFDNGFSNGSKEEFLPMLNIDDNEDDIFTAVPDATKDEDMLIQENIMQSKSDLVEKLNCENISNSGSESTDGPNSTDDGSSICSGGESSSSKDFSLFKACRQGHYEKVKNLLTSNTSIDVNMTDGDCWTCLHETSIRNCQFTGITELLLQNGANPNLKDKKGETPLHGAVLFHLVDTIKLLLQYNADYNICNNTNVSPLKLATYLKDNEILLLFGQTVSEQKIEKKKKKKRKRNSHKDFTLPLSTSPSILKKRRTSDEPSSSTTTPRSKKRINFSL